MAEPQVRLQPERRETRFAVMLFCLALAFHCWGATVGWKSLNLPGCEFRQTQTAVSALFIQREHNFSLAYPTPVLGKPWSIPLEFPLYQWTVVVVSDSLKMPLTQAARVVSMACFYLTLPALGWLLARIGLTRARRLLVLGLVVTCPLYIFYSRAFLVETMALMFGACFLVSYVRAVEQRSLLWVALAWVAGSGCGLVKVTTLMFFLMPALAWTAAWFLEDWRQASNERVRALARRIGWCALAVALPLAASVWWVNYSDSIKRLSVAGNFLLSERLRIYNFGIGQRFSPGLWRQHWQVLFLDITSWPVLVGCALLALAFGRRWWGLIVLLVVFFLGVQMVFPVLYAWHNYYYVACAFTLLFAYGLAICGVFESRLPRLVVWAVALAVYGGQMSGYVLDFYPSQKQISNGGSDLTVALRSVTAPDEVLVVAGDDWSSMTPFFAQRRALMIRRNLEHTWEEIIPAFERLHGEEVTALVLHGDQVKNQRLIDLAEQYFQIDPRPSFRWRDATVFLHRQVRPQAANLLRQIPEIELLDPAAADSDPLRQHEIELSQVLKRYLDDFSQINPRPFKYYTTFGTTKLDFEGKKFYNAHPDFRLWFHVSGGKKTFAAEVALLPDAYTEKIKHGDRTDGIEVRLEEEAPDGKRSLLFSRMINPRDVPSDRGLQQITQAFELSHDGVVVLSIGPGPNGGYARDWAILGHVDINLENSDEKPLIHAN